ncbi:pyrimidine dimer DNA glycosylase/endonuclease V [Carboxylicivirga sp. N1Y90]|uniref:pyrimidine dimer DNA glycosylase/endonuclease V n=1 Tax=Carboxylicivirga fragile TaxID=3417571 RepID=UPI003D32D480|nr:hypothetical protein [Marinilabiliaceae bacterium N1Y90]
MRIWSLHPKYLDAKGLVALWRETLLAKNVLEGKTKGYKNHPQLDRFKATLKPINSINYYLQKVWDEANTRGYNFDRTKFVEIEAVEFIDVTNGQMDFEIQHLLLKLKKRDIQKYSTYINNDHFDVHPLFKIIAGGIEEWEKI